MNSSVYILRSLKTDEYYIGCSDNPSRRLEEHNSKKVAATKYKVPYVLLFQQEYGSKEEALKIESRIKKWKRKDFIDKIVAEGEVKIVGD